MVTKCNSEGGCLKPKVFVEVICEYVPAGDVPALQDHVPLRQRHHRHLRHLHVILDGALPRVLEALLGRNGAPMAGKHILMHGQWSHLATFGHSVDMMSHIGWSRLTWAMWPHCSHVVACGHIVHRWTSTSRRRSTRGRSTSRGCTASRRERSTSSRRPTSPECPSGVGSFQVG